MKVVTKQQMRDIELASLEYGFTLHRLMENAGSAAAAFIRRTFDVQSLNCMIFCGSGNNGGDGLVVARRLFEHNANILIVLVDAPPSSIEGAIMYEMSTLMSLPMITLAGNEAKVAGYLKQADIIVDAIYGTGFHGKMAPLELAACGAINDAIAAVISLDIPSGVECDSGDVSESAIKADFTVVFDCLKPLHTNPQSLEHCGQIELVEIGVPEEAKLDVLGKSHTLQTDEVLKLLPVREKESHKGDFGRLLCICGSTIYPGAAALSVMGALRCGVGRVTLAAIPDVCGIVANRVMECTYLPLKENVFGGIDYSSSKETLEDSLAGATAILFGCGMGNNAHTAKLLSFVLKTVSCPVIVDADGINALVGNLEFLKDTKAQIILTPHFGEMARLCKLAIPDIQENYKDIAEKLASTFNITVVLKSHETVVATPKRMYINTTGNAGLAKGGSGDILAGMIASFAAQGLETGIASACAVHLHGLAADHTAQRLSKWTMLPSDILEDLANIVARK